MVKKAIFAAITMAATITAHAEGKTFQEDSAEFSRCILAEPQASVIGKLQRNKFGVDARTDDSPITKQQKSGLKESAKTWEKCMANIDTDGFMVLARVQLEPLVAGASGQFKTWSEFHAAQIKALSDLQQAMAKTEAQEAQQAREAQARQQQQAATEALLKSAREDSERQAEAQRRMAEAQERMARDNAINNGLNNLIQSMQPRQVTPMFAPQMNCNSRQTNMGVQTNCW
ncbi:MULTISPECIES: hypothetical protein [Delftia]|uniref:hypothetical protein n=1 Tax=Delftia TaxID=80865 RepID=UPI000F81668D|nr:MULTISPECIES: hypothetical protein [Delftia]WEM00073.1 hypothetical protein PW274_07245 [Delftia tsuruhatensis]